MIKLHLGYFNNSYKNIILIRFSDISDDLRSVGTIYNNYYCNFRISSITHPFLSMGNNTLYFPGKLENRDNDIIFISINSKLTGHDHIRLSNICGNITEKIIQTIDNYNNKLSNLDIKYNKSIKLREIPYIEILKIEKEIILNMENNEEKVYHNMFTDIPRHYKI